MIKINISDRPLDNDHQYHCPIPLFLPADPDVSKDASDTQTLAAFDRVPKNIPLLLKGSGDPACLADQIAMVLRKNGWPHVEIDRSRHPDRYKKTCGAWPDLYRPWFHLDGTHLIHRIKNFFDFYDQCEKIPDIPQQGICGHYPRGPKTRTEINLAYDLSNSPNPELMTSMRSLFDSLAPWWLDKLSGHGLDFRHEPGRVTLRMVEYCNSGMTQDYKSHVDTSVVTMLLYHDAPNLHVRQYLNSDYSYAASQIVDISDFAARAVGTVIPGYLFPDEFDVWMPSCWHGVITPASINRRRSLILRIEPRDLTEKLS